MSSTENNTTNNSAAPGTVAVIGAHGKVARLAIPRLAEQGYEVIGVIRNPDHAGDVEADGATPAVLDIQEADEAVIEDLLRSRGVDTLVWSAGAGGGSPERTWAIDRDAAIRSMDAAAKAGVRHYVMVSYFGAGPDHGVDEDNSFYPYAQAKTEADAHLESSGLNFTLLRPSRLTLEEATGKIDASSTTAKETSRDNVAAMIAASVAHGPAADAAPLNRVIEFNDGETPIEDVFSA